MLLYQILAYTIRGKIREKPSYKSNDFKISAPTWNEKLELSDGSYSVWNIRDYFEYIIKKKKNETQIDNPPIRIYVNKIGNGVTFKIKTEHYLQLFMLETMKLPGSTKVKTLKMKMVKIYLI